MGHAKEIVTVDSYGENSAIIDDWIPEITEFIKEVASLGLSEQLDCDELLDIVIDTLEFIKV